MNIRLIKSSLFAVCLLAISLGASAQSDTLRLSVQLTFRKAVVTGLCLMVTSDKHETVGSVINEFGLKAFDFVYNKQRNKLKLENVTPALDKWYIRRVLRHDMQYIVPILIEAGECEYNNTKRGIEYVFKPLKQYDNETGE